jgi:hypothetical protein
MQLQAYSDWPEWYLEMYFLLSGSIIALHYKKKAHDAACGHNSFLLWRPCGSCSGRCWGNAYLNRCLGCNCGKGNMLGFWNEIQERLPWLSTLDALYVIRRSRSSLGSLSSGSEGSSEPRHCVLISTSCKESKVWHTVRSTWNLGSSVSIVTGQELDSWGSISSRDEGIFSTLQQYPPPLVPGPFPQGYGGWGVKPTIQLHLVLSPRTTGLYLHHPFRHHAQWTEQLCHILWRCYSASFFHVSKRFSYCR